MKPSPPVAVAFCVALLLRLGFIAAWPDNIGLDGFQRWAGRDWLLVQGWLPGAQALVWLVARLGGDVLAARVAMAVVGALAVAAGTAVTEAVGGRTAAWVYASIGAYGPFLLWSTGLYQEGVFLLLLFTGLTLAMRGNTTLGDLVIGGVGLVRYEGWPLVALYVAWRRDPRALLAGWGALLWAVGRGLLGWAGHEASPVDYFEDWADVLTRFSALEWIDDTRWLSTMALWSGAYAWLIMAAVAMRSARARPVVTLLLVMAITQILIVMLWVAGLERATYRMLVIPVMIAAVPGSVAVASLWERASGRGRRVAIAAGLVIVAAAGLLDGQRNARMEARWTRPERDALASMAECPECRWYVDPRTNIGPRSRHDGCELMQGVSSIRREEDFLCAVWSGDARRQEECDGTVTWDGDAYVVRRSTSR